MLFFLLFRVLWPMPFTRGRHGKLGITMTYPRTLSQKRSLSLHCLFALNLILFQSNVRSSSIFDYLVLCLSSLRPAYLAQIFPVPSHVCVM